jgi:quercetin dioxygenase-like cupin family protein
MPKNDSALKALANYQSRLSRIRDEANSQAEKNVAGEFYRPESAMARLRQIKPGQEVSAHIHDNMDDMWICIKGQGIFFPEPGKEARIERDDIVLTQKGEWQGMKNTGDEDFIFISLQYPSPIDGKPLAGEL